MPLTPISNSILIADAISELIEHRHYQCLALAVDKEAPTTRIDRGCCNLIPTCGSHARLDLAANKQFVCVKNLAPAIVTVCCPFFDRVLIMLTLKEYSPGRLVAYEAHRTPPVGEAKSTPETCLHYFLVRARHQRESGWHYCGLGKGRHQ